MACRNIFEKTARRGISLVEILVVVVISGLLMGVSVMNYQASQTRARNTGVSANVHQIQLALENYAADNGYAYPATTVTTSTPMSNEGLMSPAFIGTGYLAGNRLPLGPWSKNPQVVNCALPVEDQSPSISANWPTVLQTAQQGVWTNTSSLGHVEDPPADTAGFGMVRYQTVVMPGSSAARVYFMIGTGMNGAQKVTIAPCTNYGVYPVAN